MDWLPLEPGLYHRPRAENARREAQSQVVARHGDLVILSPSGKTSMVEGGFGCVLIAAKPMFDGSYKLLTATSTGIAHQGFVVAVPLGVYADIAERIAKEGALQSTVTGELRRLAVRPKSLDGGQPSNGSCRAPHAKPPK